MWLKLYKSVVDWIVKDRINREGHKPVLAVEKKERIRACRPMCIIVCGS